jgi:phage tail-like protein
MAAKDPLISAWFSVEFQGSIKGAFRECTGLGSENAVVTEKASDEKGQMVYKRLPGRMQWADITLRRGITDEMDMWKWRKLCEQGKIDEARKNGSIVMYDTKGTEVARWNLTNAWPSKLTGPTANAGDNQVGIEEMVITHEGYERVK